MDSDSERVVEAVEKSLNYSFVNKSLVRDALRHTSFATFGRLQTLGHNVIRLAFTTYLHLAYPNLLTHQIARLRGVNLAPEKLARISFNLGLHQLVKNNTHMNQFFQTVPTKDDPVPSGGFSKPPKILSEIFESVAGAVYTDVNYHVHRLWEILRGCFEPVYTLDDLKQRPQVLATLFRVGDKAGKPITFRFYGDIQLVSAHVYLGDTCIALGSLQENRGYAMMDAAEHALHELSQTMPIETVMGETTLRIQKINAIKESINHPPTLANGVAEGGESRKGFVFSAKSKTPTTKFRKFKKERTGKKPSLRQAKLKEKIAENSSASHILRALKFSLNDDLRKTPPEMVMDDKSLDIETEDAKYRLIEKSPNPTNSVEQGEDAGKEFVCSATIETPTKETAMNEDCQSSKTEDATVKLIERLPNPANSVEEGEGSRAGLVCSATIGTPSEAIVMDEDILDNNKTEDAKEKLIKKSMNPTNSVEEGGGSEKGVVGSADKIETPTRKKKRKRKEQKIPDIEAEDAKEKLIEKSPNPTNSVEQSGGAGKGFVCSATEERVVITID